MNFIHETRENKIIYTKIKENQMVITTITNLTTSDSLLDGKILIEY